MLMRLQFAVREPLTLPIQYNHMVQGLLYGMMTAEVASFLHGDTFQVDRRTFRMIAFSRLLGRHVFDPSRGTITFDGPTDLWVASPLDLVCRELATALTRVGRVRIGSGEVELQSVAFESPQVTAGAIIVQTLSPVAASSTLERRDGRTYRVFYDPRERQFSEAVMRNLERKFRLLYARPPSLDPPFRIRPARTPRLNVVLYKGGVIKGYTGYFEVRGHPEVLQLGLDAGFGEHNGSGFGLCRLVREVACDAH